MQQRSIVPDNQVADAVVHAAARLVLRGRENGSSILLFSTTLLCLSGRSDLLKREREARFVERQARYSAWLTPARSGLRSQKWTLLTKRRSISTGTLLGRFPTLAQVADFAAFVASDRAGAMTGAIANLTCGSLVD